MKSWLSNDVVIIGKNMLKPVVPGSQSPAPLPLRQDSHASGAEDVERRLLVLHLGDVLRREAQEGVNIIAGFFWSDCQL